ncbi:phosphotransferase [Halobellus sp. Atlit-38R]|uniref:phosphotransferase family protein n=1 Tax=Halobellus sp. Atlit-38R TaxID=2282131 RepID=UPI000EF22E5B|nr:aminoglycoside phosphotransferase family protein [Halobellus sp. Atlit-38R]RLM89245.1 phosphotransferase [Halobellus sp. Atlit-38R]
MTERPDASLRSVISAVAPGQSVASVNPIERGNRKQTAVVRFADADPIVVQQTPDPSSARVEARLLSAIDERTSVPVARPIDSGDTGDDGWLVTPLLAGDDLHEAFVDLDAATQQAIAGAFGRFLAELHEAFRFDRYGPLTVDDGDLVTEPRPPRSAPIDDEFDLEDGISGCVAATPAEWREWLVTYGRANVARLPSEFDDLRSGLLDVVASLPATTGPTPRLFPWDFRPGNALVADGTVTAVLDWESPLAADPALSVAKAEYLVADWYVSEARADRLRAAFREGYTSVRDSPEIRPAHRVCAIASAAVDSRGVVTNPQYPPVGRAAAVEFHRRALERVL